MISVLKKDLTWEEFDECKKCWWIKWAVPLIFHKFYDFAHKKILDILIFLGDNAIEFFISLDTIFSLLTL